METIKHECGVALIRLLKPLSYYQEKYGTWAYGLNKLYLMMEKQHNRGQEGAGIACVNLQSPIGGEYMFRERAEGANAIDDIFRMVGASILSPADKDTAAEDTFPPFAGQLYMGHLRYSTTGKRGITFVHPFLRRNNWRAKNLCLCGNFNMTNMDRILNNLVEQGQSPRSVSDSHITLELMGHRLDREVERVYEEARALGKEGQDITRHIEDHIDMTNVLRTTMSDYDGGYVMCGLTGSGEMFAMRDPWGIRPAFYHQDDEVVVVASERPVLQTSFDLPAESIHELPAGHALITRKNGQTTLEEIIPAKGHHSCSFERIYFSRGSDQDIYKERKKLGEQLVDQVMKAVEGDLDHTVFSYIPNTAEVAFYGMMEGFRSIHKNVRMEKVAWKDIKLRTFITGSDTRKELASHVYDITYGSLRPGIDNLVVIDDSIVRGTTLRESIFKILDRLRPRKIVMVSSSPQIRYPDYYGIDMERLEEFCAFRAVMRLLGKTGREKLIEDTLVACRRELLKRDEDMHNCVCGLYEPFTVEDINKEIVDMLRPEGMKTPVEMVFQSIEGLHRACPHHPGDWYFTGRYPTPGGIRLVNETFVNYMERIEN